MTPRDSQFSAKGLDSLIRDLRSVRAGRYKRHPVEDDLFAYATGTLPPTEGQRMQRHLDACDECASRINAFQAAAQAWEGADGDRRLEELINRHRRARHTQNEIVFATGNNSGSGSTPETSTEENRRNQREQLVSKTLSDAGAIERECDYTLPCGLHSDTHINLGKICRRENSLAGIVSALDEALQGETFDTVVSTGWALATIARRLVLRRRTQTRRRIRHVMVEGYDPPTVLEEVTPGARVILLLDVVVTGGQVLRVTEELWKQKATSVKAIAIVDADFSGRCIATPIERLCRIPMDLARSGECRRCGMLPSAEFNPIAGRMTKKKVQPRSPSEFLSDDSVARELWESVNTAAAFEHHRIVGTRHYLGFVDTAALLRHPETGPLIVEKLCRRIEARSGVPDVVLVPARARGLLFGGCLVRGFEQFLGVSGVRLERVRQQAGHFALKGVRDLSGLRVLVADAAAGHGDTLDELALLSTSAGAASVAGAVLLSRLSEVCERSFDERLSGGFVRLYSMPVRPITVRDKNRMNCSVCQRRQDLKQAVAELPAGRVREVAKRLSAGPRFRRRTVPAAPSILSGERQGALFPLGPLSTCRPGVASGIALHALHAAMGDGMAPLSLPEIASNNIPSAKRAALVADLPAGVLKWSGPPLLEQLCGFLKRGRDRDVWTAIVELMSRSGSTDWVDCLGDAISNAETFDPWMDDQFWARMILVVHRLARGRPGTGDQIRPPLQALVETYDQTSAHLGLEGMLDATYGIDELIVDSGLG
jgi:orotate phosphoribosyltransferase